MTTIHTHTPNKNQNKIQIIEKFSDVNAVSHTWTVKVLCECVWWRCATRIRCRQKQMKQHSQMERKKEARRKKNKYKRENSCKLESRKQHTQDKPYERRKNTHTHIFNILTRCADWSTSLRAEPAESDINVNWRKLRERYRTARERAGEHTTQIYAAWKFVF